MKFEKLEEKYSKAYIIHGEGRKSKKWVRKRFYWLVVGRVWYGIVWCSIVWYGIWRIGMSE